jgi:hypothetical protein
MTDTIAEQILSEHLVEGKIEEGSEIGLTIDQTLTQDATGTMVYLEFESLGIPAVKPQTAVSTTIDSYSRAPRNLGSSFHPRATVFLIMCIGNDLVFRDRRFWAPTVTRPRAAV